MIPGLLSSFLNHLRRRSWLFLQGPCSLSAGPPQSGTLETTVAYFGSPMYLTVEDQLIESMALEGITNFFAAGDSGSYSTDLESFIPATSPGSTPVGGGQLVAADS